MHAIGQLYPHGLLLRVRLCVCMYRTVFAFDVVCVMAFDRSDQTDRVVLVLQTG